MAQLRETFLNCVTLTPGKGDRIYLSRKNAANSRKVLNEKDVNGKGLATNGGIFLKNKTQRVVPKLAYFVLGDNRKISLDSRQMGFVPQKNIIGKVLMCYWNCK